MDSKLLDEKKQRLSENQDFKSFQTSPVPPKTKMGQKDDAGFSSPVDKKELDRQMKEIPVSHKYKLLKHQHIMCSEEIKHLQEPLRRLEEMNEKLMKEKTRILKGIELIIKQEQILKDIQIKLNHLHNQLKHPELIGLKKSKELQIPVETTGAESSQEIKKVDNSPSSSTQETDVVKQDQKSCYLKRFCLCLGNSVWLFVRNLLYSVFLCLTLLLVYKNLTDPTWVYQLDIPDIICHQPWTH